MQDLQRVQELLAEAQAELNRYDQLRANIAATIEQYERRIRLLGGAHPAPPSPAVEQRRKESVADDYRPWTNSDIFRKVLLDSGDALTPRQVAQLAEKLGWSTESANPVRIVDATLRKMVAKELIEFVGRGQFRAKEFEAP